MKLKIIICTLANRAYIEQGFFRINGLINSPYLNVPALENWFKERNAPEFNAKFKDIFEKYFLKV